MMNSCGKVHHSSSPNRSFWTDELIAMQNVIQEKTRNRSKLEYGLALSMLPEKVSSRLQNVQNLAMRKMTSTPRVTSTKALQRFLQIEPITARNAVHNIRFASSLHNSLDSSSKSLVPAFPKPQVKVYHHYKYPQKPSMGWHEKGQSLD
jgi:hypothetical protein